ncbi:MAG: hypothetical protein K2Y01_06125 [Rhabdochlamydiaceae bacterium]|nr:hypothetical protein [Rhabdochlamydiaceae bacterium]
MNPLFIIAATLSCFIASVTWADEAETASAPVSLQAPAEGVAMLPRGLITPTVEPLVKNGWDIVVDVDFIWWKSHVSNFNFAVVNNRPMSPASPFEPGLKLGTGMGMVHDGWDLYFQYTWLSQPETSKSAKAKIPSFSTQAFPFLDPLHPETLSVMILSSAESTRKFTFNVLDSDIGRNFFISKRLTLRPFFGFKLASMFEKTTLSYEGVESVRSAQSQLRQNLNGVGIRGGINTVWHIVRTFGFYGDLALTTLWSDFHNRFINDVTTNALTDSYTIKNTTLDVIPVIEAGLGATYMVWFSNERYLLTLKAGWEEQIWLNYNRNILSSTGSSSGSLTLQGLTFKVGFAF